MPLYLHHTFYHPYPLCNNLCASRAQAKRRKIGGSTAAPAAQEPEPAEPDSPATRTKPIETRTDAPANAPQPSEPADDNMATPENPPHADPKPLSPSTATEDILITGAGYQSSEPHVLTRHTSKAKANSPEKLEFEFPVLEKMTADELHAGYLNRLFTSRNMELKLVGLMKKKYEVLLLSCFSLYPHVAPKSWFSIANSRPGLTIHVIIQFA